METLDDICITLDNKISHTMPNRIVGVNLAESLNPAGFQFQSITLMPQSSEVLSAESHPEVPQMVFITLARSAAPRQPDGLAQVNYTLSTASSSGLATGRILLEDPGITLADVDFEVTVQEGCCEHDEVYIDIRHFHNGLPVTLTGVTGGRPIAGTHEIIETDVSDFNDDFNDDFGGETMKRIKYTLNSTSGFWKTPGARAKLAYTYQWKGRTGKGAITITSKCTQP